MKKKLILILPILILVPIAVFAYDTYDHIVGCGIRTIPQFIKASIDIVIRIGIPVASVFLIWAGFLFLTAQGDPGKLTAAKKAFVWACIGFGVLLASWLLAIAFENVIISFSGGTQQGTTNDPCVGGGNPPPPSTCASLGKQCNQTNKCASGTIVSPTPSDCTGGTSCCSREMDPVAGWIIDGRRTPTAGTAGFYEQCAIQYPQQIGGDAMAENGLDPTDPQLFQKSETILHEHSLNRSFEESFVFMDFGSDSGYLWHSANGGEASVPVTNEKMIADFIDTSLPDTTRVTFMHTHPAAYINGKAPPSIRDLEMAYATKITTLAHGIIPARFVVSDATGVWEYSVPSGSAFARAENVIVQKVQEFSALPEVRPYLGPEYECVMGQQLVTQLTKALNGEFGAAAKALAEAIDQANQPLIPLREQDERLEASSSMAERLAIMQEREATLRSLGIVLNYTPM